VAFLDDRALKRTIRRELVAKVVELGRPFGLARAHDPEAGMFPGLQPRWRRHFGSPFPPALDCPVRKHFAGSAGIATAVTSAITTTLAALDRGRPPQSRGGIAAP